MTTLNDGIKCTFDPNCITYSDVLNYASCINVADYLCCSQEVIERHIEMAIDLVESITCIKICPYNEVKRFDGDGSCRLYFTPETSDKLLSFTEVSLVECNENAALCSEVSSREF